MTALCDFYEIVLNDPKHLSLGAYFGAIGTIILAKIN
jgi:hypothetical protein